MTIQAIKGVNTSTAGFLGPSRRGPIGIVSKAIASLAGFERIYGGGEQMRFKTAKGADLPPRDNYLWHAVRAFFAQGGKRVYIVRVFKPIAVAVSGRHDGQPPTSAEYAGNATGRGAKTGLAAFEEIGDISMVAAPGVCWSLVDPVRKADALAILQKLIQHAEKMGRRMALLDSGSNQDVTAVGQFRANFDSAHAAFYYPWVRVLDPHTKAVISVPPSGFVAGVLSRTAASKAPTNEVLQLADDVERKLSPAQAESLNRDGVNCIRSFPKQGVRLWGARTLSSDPEWQYVNVRRYVSYLEASIDKGTQFAVFEPNAEPLWAKVRSMVEAFLHNEWKSGSLQGNTPDKAFFVKCDSTTMTQNDLDSGRLVCMIGVAPVRPAEFVIFRIGQWTADRTP